MTCVLLFGTGEVIKSILLYYRINVLTNIHDIDKFDDRKYIECNLIETYEKLTPFVIKHLSDRFYLEKDLRISLRDKIFCEVIATIPLAIAKAISALKLLFHL